MSAARFSSSCARVTAPDSTTDAHGWASAAASAIDRALFGYFGMKLATERVLEQSGIGWTTLRATQFTT